MQTNETLQFTGNDFKAIKSERSVPAEFGKDWSIESGKLILVNYSNMKPESIQKAKETGRLKNPDLEKCLIFRTDDPKGSTPKFIMLTQFLGFCEKSKIEGFIEVEKDTFEINPNLKAKFDKNKLELEYLNKQAEAPGKPTKKKKAKV